VSFYGRHILPKVVNFACSTKPAMRQREKVVPLVRGRVLEVGVGSGLNLALYDGATVTHVWGLDPSQEMTDMAQKAADATAFDVEFLHEPCESISLDDNVADTVLVTYTLCTIAETEPALREMARVLKPEGQLIFCEHGAAPDQSVRRWQRRIAPLWKRFGGGCHLDREIPKLIEAGGFKIDSLETMYLPGWRPATYNYWGVATAA
jgi:ubiquinone/menaquinone biosynthesis C-methylase UbiE